VTNRSKEIPQPHLGSVAGVSGDTMMKFNGTVTITFQADTELEAETTVNEIKAALADLTLDIEDDIWEDGAE